MQEAQLLDDGELIPAYMPPVQRRLVALVRRRFASTYWGRYRSLRPIDEAEVTAWRLPVLAARLGERIEEERPLVLELIQRELERQLTGDDG